MWLAQDLQDIIIMLILSHKSTWWSKRQDKCLYFSNNWIKFHIFNTIKTNTNFGIYHSRKGYDSKFNFRGWISSQESDNDRKIPCFPMSDRELLIKHPDITASCREVIFTSQKSWTWKHREELCNKMKVSTYASWFYSSISFWNEYFA